jgi:hypothetical protein
VGVETRGQRRPSLMFMSVARRSRGSHDMRAAAAFAPI